MGGGGHIIIRNAIKQALSDPLIHGILSDKHKAIIDPILAEDINNWTPKDDAEALKVFEWCARNC
jgi:hypothetical protein